MRAWFELVGVGVVVAISLSTMRALSFWILSLELLKGMRTEGRERAGEREEGNFSNVLV